MQPPPSRVSGEPHLPEGPRPGISSQVWRSSNSIARGLPTLGFKELARIGNVLVYGCLQRLQPVVAGFVSEFVQQFHANDLP